MIPDSTKVANKGRVSPRVYDHQNEIAKRTTNNNI